MRRYDRRRKYHVILLAIILIACVDRLAPVGASRHRRGRCAVVFALGRAVRDYWCLLPDRNGMLFCSRCSGNWLGCCVVCPPSTPAGYPVRFSPCSIGKRHPTGTLGGWLWGSCWQSIFPASKSQNPLGWQRFNRWHSTSTEPY